MGDSVLDIQGNEKRSRVLSSTSGVKSVARRALNALLAHFGFKIARLGVPETSDVRDFLPLDETVAAAERAGLSVGDYIDTVLNNIPGATQQTIDEMSRLGVFSNPIETVVEIGPGSGRYLEKIVSVCSPTRYEIYETSADWAAYLARKYNLLDQPTDGRSLSSTPDRSADLVHAHKVFPGIPFSPTCAYWFEMARVAKPGAFVVFDIMTETCLGMDTLAGWSKPGLQLGSYPAAMPRGVAIDFFTQHGFDVIGTFWAPLGCGKTEYFVFRRAGAG